MEDGPRWRILSKNKTQNNTAVIIKIINTVKKVVRPKWAPTTMFLPYNPVIAIGGGRVGYRDGPG